VQWRLVILGFLSVAMVAGFALAVMFAHESREQQKAAEIAAEKNARKRYRAPRSAMPKGLPPLSSVPRPADDPALATPATQ